MAERQRYRYLMTKDIQGIRSDILRPLSDAGKTAVLLLMLAAPGVTRAEHANTGDLQVYEFASQFDTFATPGQLQGIMATDGQQHRIAFYWVEPYVLRESDLFLRYVDLLFTPEAVHYWVHGDAQPRAFRWIDAANEPLLPQSQSTDLAVRSALAILDRIQGPTDIPGVSLQIGTFFELSRSQSAFVYKAAPGAAEGADPWTTDASDVDILNGLPYGREYVKEQRSDGTLLWGVRRESIGQPLTIVIVTPLADVGEQDYTDHFDPATLGRSKLVPEAYQLYWSFDRAHSELTASENDQNSARQLCDEIESWRAGNETPAQVCRALDRLRFKAALATGDTEYVWAAAQAATTGLCADESVDRYQCLLQLGSMSGKIDAQYPERAGQHLRPLVAQTVQRAGSDIIHELGRLMALVDVNRWFTYGDLVLDEIRRQGLAPDEAIAPLATTLETSRVARRPPPLNPADMIPSVRRYLALIDADPPEGTIDMNGLRAILAKGLASHYGEGQTGAKRTVVENVLSSLRLIVGEGPFCGDPNQLTESIEGFSYLYLVLDRASEPIETILATFLALSFCDTSTAQDHEMLCFQFCEVRATLESQVNTMINERGLTALVGTEDVQDVFRIYERVFRRYVDDPLWPPFKFPLTLHELNTVTTKLELAASELALLFDETSLKFEYARNSAGLKQTMIREISRVAQRLLPEIAFLRRPSYPGVSCRYRGQYGFTAAIAGPPYTEGDRPKAKFKVMKYFHLGHRLRDIVQTEREQTPSASESAATPIQADIGM